MECNKMVRPFIEFFEKDGVIQISVNVGDRNYGNIMTMEKAKEMDEQLRNAIQEASIHLTQNKSSESDDLEA